MYLTMSHPWKVHIMGVTRTRETEKHRSRDIWADGSRVTQWRQYSVETPRYKLRSVEMLELSTPHFVPVTDWYCRYRTLLHLFVLKANICCSDSECAFPTGLQPEHFVHSSLTLTLFCQVAAVTHWKPYCVCHICQRCHMFLSPRSLMWVNRHSQVISILQTLLRIKSKKV